jgi:hypothetical protein
MVVMSHFSSSEDAEKWDIGFNGCGTKLTRDMAWQRLTH